MNGNILKIRERETYDLEGLQILLNIFTEDDNDANGSNGPEYYVKGLDGVEKPFIDYICELSADMLSHGESELSILDAVFCEYVDFSGNYYEFIKFNYILNDNNQIKAVAFAAVK